MTLDNDEITRFEQWLDIQFDAQDEAEKASMLNLTDHTEITEAAITHAYNRIARARLRNALEAAKFPS